MNTDDLGNNYEPYVLALLEQLEQHISGLDELTDCILTRPLTFNERSAAERSLQVIVESAIGCSKHYLKAINKPVPSEARATIERLYEILALTSTDINDMRGAVGMRNAIIHDYLNLDWKKLEKILRTRKYKQVENYSKTILEKLLKL
ncbi:MAG: hypothetical protein COA74_00285 [Gammaproteobacteria bacterium]|nr:MAG: hypothetical protein COA74_00285 [Gammaproteobacteria bacterium]